MKMTQVEIDSVLAEMHRQGFKVFETGNYNLNLIGLRDSDNKAGTFNDWFCSIFKVDGEWIGHRWPCTTDPSNYYLEDHPLRSDGTAIIASPQQVRGGYVIGMHKKYAALVQRGKNPIKIWRDNTRDETLDWHDEATSQVGFFAVNIHASDKNPFDGGRERGEDAAVGGWSAGCQVFANNSDYLEHWGIVKVAEAIWGSTYSYSLLEMNLTTNELVPRPTTFTAWGKAA